MGKVIAFPVSGSETPGEDADFMSFRDPFEFLLPDADELNAESQEDHRRATSMVENLHLIALEEEINVDEVLATMEDVQSIITQLRDTSDFAPRAKAIRMLTLEVLQMDILELYRYFATTTTEAARADIVRYLVRARHFRCLLEHPRP